MTRGTISLKVVHDRLGAVASGLQDLRALPVDSLETFLEDFRNPAAAESLLLRAIEALLDTARPDHHGAIVDRVISESLSQ